MEGEEGIDYQVMPNDFKDPEQISEKQLEKEIRRSIKELKLNDPEKAKEYEELFFKKSELDEMFNQKIDLSELKMYPGSPKGPLPEDDP